MLPDPDASATRCAQLSKEFQESLNKFEVPAAEQKEQFDMVGKTKADIVVRK
jgi:hemoglobin